MQNSIHSHKRSRPEKSGAEGDSSPARPRAVPLGELRAGGRERKNQGGNMKKDDVKQAILKVALGYSVEEVTEEYDAHEGELRLVKRKETKKDVPPDLKAAMLLMGKKDYAALSDDELESERDRLLAQLKEEKDE